MPRMPHDTTAEDLVVETHRSAPRSLRIAVVTETWPPEVNGVATTIARVVEGLKRRHHEVQLIRPRQAEAGAPPPHEVLLRGLPIPRYPNLRMGMPAKGRLLKLWSLQRPDVVHIATEGPLGWSALRAALHLKLPVTSDFRTNFHAYSRHYGIGWLKKPIMGYLRKFHNRTAVTMAPTEPLRRELATAGFANVEVVARGVDVRQFDPVHRSAALRASWGVAEGDLVVACVGRLAPEKNLDLLAEAFEAIAARQPRARLLLVGEGPMRETLAARLPGAILAGQRRGTDLAAHYASADLFLFPSLTETFGNVTPEAMASALPVVAFDYAAAAQLIVHRTSGLLAPVDDGAAFLRQAVAAAEDAPLRANLGREARQRALAQDWDAVIARFEGVLLRVIDPPAAPAVRGAALAMPAMR